MKVLTVVGARPQFIKSGPVSKAIRKVATEILVHTGQHYDTMMSDIFFWDLVLPKPDYNLEVGSGYPGQQTARMLEGLEEIILKEHPDFVLIYGDTNSTLAGALVGVKLRIPIVHIEAGLRSFNKEMPEEINRIVADHASSLLFCPTQTAVENLQREGIRKGVHLVGDVMFDALWENLALAKERSSKLKELNLQGKRYALLTVHRAENTDVAENLCNIIQALEQLENLFDVIVFPVHPRTKKRLYDLGWYPPNHILAIDPVSYLDMLSLEVNAFIILSDSGGVQKEAFWVGVPCLTLRRETEWVETVESGWNVIVGTDSKKIVEACKKFEKWKPHQPPKWPWEKGAASASVADLLVEHIEFS